MSFDRAARPSPWLGVAGVCGIYVAFGLTLGVMAPLIDEISADLELSRGAMGSILGAWALIYVFTAVPAGSMVDRLGLRTALFLGGCSITASLALRSLASNGTTLFAAVAVFGVGGPLVSIAMPKLVASLFAEDDRRLPTGLGVASPGLGSAVGLAATNPLLLPLAGDNWRGVLLLAAGFSALMTALWLIAARAVAHVPRTTGALDLRVAPRLLRLRSMQFILVISLFSFFFSHGLSNWLPEMLTAAGQSDNAAGYLAAISTTVGIAGSLTIARLVPAARRAVALTTVFVLIGVLVVSLASLPFTALLGALALLGFSRAGIIPLLFLEIMGDPDIDLTDIGVATGLFFAIGEIGGFTGPYVTGWVADTDGGFSAATVVLLGVAVAAGLASIGLARSRSATGVSP